MPEFTPRKLREKRKSHPVFHSDLRPKSARNANVKVAKVTVNLEKKIDAI